MTTLGKILVIINFVFSLLAAALIILVFAKQTNWKDNADKWHKSYDVVYAGAQAYAQDIEDFEKRAEVKDTDELKQKLVQIPDLAKQVAALTEDRKKLELQVADLQKKYEDEVSRSKTAGATSLGATEESKRLNDEVKKLQELAAKREDQIVELQKTTKEAQDRAVGAEINFRTMRDRVQRMGEEIERLAKDNERLKNQGLATTSTAPGGGPAVKPPPEEVEGLVLQSDPKTGLVTLSIGSDAGLNKGNTLDVFRLQPKPEYVGMVRIVDSRPHESVARAMMPLRAGPIQKGDRVGSNILGRR